MQTPNPPLTQEQVLAQALPNLAKIARPDRVKFARGLLGQRIPEVVRNLDSIAQRDLERTILFLSRRPQHAREPKIARAARLAGWNPILIYSGRANYDPAEYFSYHSQVTDPLALLLLTWLFRGPLVHLFTDNGAEAQPFIAMKQARTVLDLYDTCSGQKWHGEEGAEKECFALRGADGMLHRDLRGHYLRKLHGYTLPQHNLLMIDPLWETPAPAKIQPTEADGEIRVVSAGWTGDGDSSILQIVQMLCTGGVHVHYYPYPVGKGEQEYRRLSRLFPDTFHFEEPVFGAEFMAHLRRYDFGVSTGERFVFGEEPERYTSDYLAGCGSSRVMDYVQAGLGIIVPRGLAFQHWCSRRYAPVVVDTSIELLRHPKRMLLDARATMRRREQAAFESITVGASSERLGKFYARVCSQDVTSRAVAA